MQFRLALGIIINHIERFTNMKRLLRILFFLVVFIGLALLGVSYYFSSLIITPGDTSMDDDKEWIAEDWGTTYDAIMTELPTPDTFSILSQDGTRLSGWFFENPNGANCGVVLTHGWGSSRVGMLKYKDIFWDCGCDLAFFDHRKHSLSEDKAPSAGINEKFDLVRVTEWLQSKTGLQDDQIAWMGESWGAATALQAGALEKNVAFIVADSPFQDWETAVFERAERMYGAWTLSLAPIVMNMVSWRTGVDCKKASPISVAAAIEEPVFLIHSQEDSQTASFQSVNIAKELNPETSVFYHTDWGSDHVMDVITRPEEYESMVHQFILEEVGSFGSCQPKIDSTAVEVE